MKFARTSFLVFISFGLTSCQTWNALKNCYPVKFMDQTGSAMLGWLGENNLPTDGKPATMQERAREIESRGHYAGKTPATVGDAGQHTAAR
ncbi:hypothetical protein [Prosthecobacter sp.]|uniref:hypothetical protein n=1 Tax=Prosthecobacter sp. TaxID=1965333 RepID=UPI0037834F6A